MGVKDQPLKKGTEEDWSKVLFDMGIARFSYSSFEEQGALAPGKSIQVLKILDFGSCEADTVADEFRAKAHYESLYGEKDTASY